MKHRKRRAEAGACACVRRQAHTHSNNNNNNNNNNNGGNNNNNYSNEEKKMRGTENGVEVRRRKGKREEQMGPKFSHYWVFRDNCMSRGILKSVTQHERDNWKKKTRTKKNNAKKK